MPRNERTDYVPWYRRRDYTGNLTEEDKRYLDSFRMMAKHPAATFDELPEEAQGLISKLQVELLDLRQEKAFFEALLVSAAGIGFAVVSARGWIIHPFLSVPIAVVVGLLSSVVPWVLWRRKWQKLVDDELPKGEPWRATQEALRLEWELSELYRHKKAKRED